jgi:hypothetical protein
MRYHYYTPQFAQHGHLLNVQLFQLSQYQTNLPLKTLIFLVLLLYIPRNYARQYFGNLLHQLKVFLNSTVKSNLKLAHVSSAGRHAVNHLCADFSKNGPTLLTVSLSDHLNSSLNPSIFDNQTLLSVFSGSKLGRAKEAGV